MGFIGIVLLVIMVISAVLLVLVVLVQDDQGEGIGGHIRRREQLGFRFAVGQRPHPVHRRARRDFPRLPASGWHG